MADEIVLDEHAARYVVDMVHQATGHIVNVMGEGGRILASSMPERVGTIHEGASRIMSGQIDEIAIDEAMARSMTGVRPGYTGGIRIDGRLLGCIGIGGDPAMVKPLQKLSVLTLKQELDRQKLAGREKRLLVDVRKDIGDIAERMQVLSLNGAVLAARLGEKGRGFKIVVAEMRQLAAQIGEKLNDLERYGRQA